jgi:hypothetical protein
MNQIAQPLLPIGEQKSAMKKGADKSLSDSLVKTAEASSSIYSSSAGTGTQATQTYHPLYQATSLILPTRIREINQWLRNFYKKEPLVFT